MSSRPTPARAGTTSDQRAQRRRQLLDEREQLRRLRERVSGQQARRSRAQLQHRLTRLAI